MRAAMPHWCSPVFTSTEAHSHIQPCCWTMGGRDGKTRWGGGGYKRAKRNSIWPRTRKALSSSNHKYPPPLCRHSSPFS